MRTCLISSVSDLAVMSEMMAVGKELQKNNGLVCGRERAREREGGAKV